MKSLFILIFIVLLGAFSAYQLYTAVAWGRVQGRYRTLLKSDEPVTFTAFCIFYAVSFLALAGGALFVVLLMLIAEN